jgi:citronellol/citronellal dehydrogenase
MSSLKGKTLFITGASRGIGLAIALRAARDGANIVIAAKSATPHPKLPGTIYTAAKAIEEAGGSALPLQVDIRDEEQVTSAVRMSVERFGAIDCLVNNASAISVSDTLATSMQRYDLLMSVNARGTFLCSRLCMPHLLKADNPHILTLCPPINLKPKWFKNHTAYTISKYSMSMCVLGMAEEFRDRKVAVNGLWPRTLIATSALNIIPGTDSSKARNEDIMADSAWLVLTSESAVCTGNLFLDEEVLARAQITELDRYSMMPGQPLMQDLFVD